MDCLSHEVGFRVVGAGSDFLTVYQASALTAHLDVLLISVDQVLMSALRNWAAIHVLLPDARVVALTHGIDDHVLETVLGVGVTALHRPDADMAVLCQAVRNAAHRLVDFDPWLIERAKSVVLQPLAEAQARSSGLTVDLQAHEVTRWGKRVHLTPLEFRLLEYLAHNAGKSASSAELLEAVWRSPLSRGGTIAQVHNCIKRIRQKIEPDVKHPRYLLCERGWGYFLQDPTEPRISVSSTSHERTGQTSSEPIASKN